MFQYKQTLKSFVLTQKSVTNDDIDVMFHRIYDLRRVHFTFIHDLEPKVADKTSQDTHIGEIFKVLVSTNLD